MKIKKMDVFLLILSITIIILSINYNLLSKTFLGIYLLFLNIFTLVKVRNDKGIFVIIFALLYFNFSYIISRYIGTPSSTVSDLFTNIKLSNTMIISIDSQILFFAILNFMIGDKIKKPASMLNKKISFPYRKILVFLLELLLILILLYHLINNITESTTLLEYSIILFVFALYLTKDSKSEKLVVELILIIFSLYSLKNGDRIAILQFILADFLVNYVNKFSIKQIVTVLLIGIFLFTFFGIYGDLLDANSDMNNLSIKNTYDTLLDRRFAIDTSVAAYHAGLTIIESSTRYYSFVERIKNGFSYFTVYTILGKNLSGYVPLNVDVLKYYGNVGGGYLTSYFYFWLGWGGISLIAIYIGKLIIIFNNNGEKNIYVNLLSVFVLSTFPRWYLYAPDLLFRGVFLFSIVYFIISFVFFKNVSVMQMNNKK